jgi:hypothetical protein
VTACCVRSCMLAEDAPDGPGAAELAGLLCRTSRRRVDRLFTDLWANDDVATHNLVLRTLAGRYEWVEVGIIDPSEL